MKVIETLQRVRNGELTDEIWESSPIDFEHSIEGIVECSTFVMGDIAKMVTYDPRIVRVISVRIEL